MLALCTPPDTSAVVFSASKRCAICSRVMVLLPRISMSPAALPAGSGLRLIDSTSPKRKVALNVTVSPRVSFGSSETLSLSPIVKVSVRASMFAGVGSKVSPAASAALPM